jgi:hypothetical protein
MNVSHFLRCLTQTLADNEPVLILDTALEKSDPLNLNPFLGFQTGFEA